MKREEKRQRNRQQLLTAATEVFLEQGFDAATVRDVVARTTLGVGTFYNYFTDKESIFRAIIDQRIGEIATQVRKVRHQAHDRDSFIRLSYLAYFEALANDPISYELARRHEALIGSLYQVPMLEMAMGELQEDIQAAVRAGWLSSLDEDFLAAAFLGVGHEVGRVMIRRRPMDPVAAAEFASKLLLGGLQAFAHGQ